MLGKLYRYWTTFAPERARKFGYLQRAIDTEFLYKGHRKAWDDHLLETKTAILNGAEQVHEENLCVIMAANGVALDLPLRSLSDRFEEVLVVDMFHMPQVRRQVRNEYDNVRLLSGDITGMFRAMRGGSLPGRNAAVPDPVIPHLEDADLVVSANVLPTLARPFFEFLEGKRKYAAADLEKLEKELQQNHVTAITKKAKDVTVIVSGVEASEVHGDTVGRRWDLTGGVDLPDSAELSNNLEWEWTIYPQGTRHKKYDIIYRVVSRIYTHTSLEMSIEEEGLPDELNYFRQKRKRKLAQKEAEDEQYAEIDAEYAKYDDEDPLA